MSKNLANKNKFKQAFSLIEISIVILILGILIAGVTQSSILFSKFQISNARNLTTGSAVTRISNLVTWYETTMENSFDDAETEDNSTITNWYDLNPQSSYKNNASSSTAKPIYIKNCINNLPCLRFNGSNDYMAFNGNIFINSSYTIFIVEQRRSNKSANYIIGGTQGVVGKNLTFGYESNNLVRHSHYSVDTMDYAVSNYKSPTPIIHTVMFDKNAGRKYWLNGGVNPTASDSGTTPLTSFTGSTIGRFNTYFFNGDVAEIIIYSDSLLNRDRQVIENYLSQKWKIAIATS